MKDFREDATRKPENYKVIVVTTKGTRIFENLDKAKEIYPTLDINKHTKDFTWGMFGGFSKGKQLIRFEDWKTNEALSI